jgi:mannose-6-phosphate isomerase-like protein (cupin superfamily)
MNSLDKIPTDYQHTSPAGAEVRLLMNNHLGGIAHCTLKAGRITRAVQHKTVSEFWHVLSGKGAIWRSLSGREEIVSLTAGVTIEIPVGTQFQYRSEASADLVFLCVTMPPWSGADEATIIDQGAWTPR